MSDKDKEDPNNLYHYTSEEGYEGIKNDGKINPSVKRDDDVAYGDKKVYLTSRNPETNTSKEIATGNYDGTPQYAESKLPSTKVAIGFDRKDIKATEVDADRKIYTVDGGLDLSKSKAIYKQQNDGTYKKDKGK